MPTNQTPLQRPRRLPLSHEQEMSLRFGELASRPGFASDDERREAWFHHRDRLLQHCSRGQRPAGWWAYESPVPYPEDRNYAPAVLYEAGLLAETEVADLLAHWRKEFERAQEPGFTRCIGFAKPGDAVASWIEGKAARRAHYRWVGIPIELLTEWIQELESASPAEPAA
jgi:hypothetical protein